MLARKPSAAMAAMVLRILFPLLFGLFVPKTRSRFHPVAKSLQLLSWRLPSCLSRLQSHTPVDSQSLPRDRLCGVRCEEDGECGDFVRIYEAFETLFGHCEFRNFFGALASRLCATFEHTLYAIPLHCAGEDSIHPHVVFAEFDRKRLHKANQSPLRGRIGATVRISEATSGRGHDDNDPAS